jgi:3'-5' exoribonuclease
VLIILLKVIIKIQGLPMDRISVEQLKTKQDITSIFYVKYIAIMNAKDGKKYLNVILADATGDLESRIWTNAEETMEKISKGNFVQVSGKVNLFQGRKQFIIQNIEQINEEDIDLKEFIKASDTDPDQMYSELMDLVTNLTDVYIKELLSSILNDSEISRRLKKWQAGKTIHHAYQSGLVEHVLSCANLAVHLSPIYKVNVNYVVAGAILHDLCKIYELTDDINVEYTEEGKLVGHLVKGTELLDRFAYRIKDFPYQMKLHLKHILLSHHGEYAYGSPKIPQTSEAMLVHMIDLMDSKMASFETVKQTDNNTGHWSGFVRHLDRIIYKDELPFYDKFIESEKSSNQTSKKDKQIKPKAEASKPVQDKNLTHSLGDALKGINLKD